MARWKPGSRERLQRAALELFGEQGFDNTTVVQIAARAELTKRTFFRHFMDKREVLFAGSDAFQDALVRGVVEADQGLPPLGMVAAALVAFDWNAMAPREVQRLRQEVIVASSDLLERELIKHEALTLAFADALQRRGTDVATSRLAARAAVAVFRTAYERWVELSDDDGMAAIVNDVLDELRGVAAG